MDASLRWHDGSGTRAPCLNVHRGPHVRCAHPNLVLARNESRFMLASPGCVANICCWHFGRFADRSAVSPTSVRRIMRSGGPLNRSLRRMRSSGRQDRLNTHGLFREG